jgi:hypothetical protein
MKKENDKASVDKGIFVLSRFIFICFNSLSIIFSQVQMKMANMRYDKIIYGNKFENKNIDDF